MLCSSVFCCRIVISWNAFFKYFRTGRVRKVKFEGRRISHDWVMDEKTGVRKWFPASVLETVSGVDGNPGAVHDVLYDGDEVSCTVDHLYSDYLSSSVKFIDL
jgi:hypothetical protein